MVEQPQERLTARFAGARTTSDSSRTGRASSASSKRRQWTPVYGTEWVQRWTYPNTIPRPGEPLVLDGMTYSVLDTGGGGDAAANSVWFGEAPARTAFLGDLVSTEPTPTWPTDSSWPGSRTHAPRESLATWSSSFPGTGSPKPAGALVSAQRDYLLTLAAHVKELSDGRPNVSDAANAEIKRR
jgi:hypothetical protein